jgi:hypothetical protein
MTTAPHRSSNAMRDPNDLSEQKRTTGLALWRYSHDYLKAAQSLCDADRVTCHESQALYHLSAQGIEFALKAYLRINGVPVDELESRIGHSLDAAFDGALARGLRPPPAPVAVAIRWIAPHHGQHEFRHVVASVGKFPDLEPLLTAGSWILNEIAADAVVDYYTHFAHGANDARDEMLRRMRADLDATRSRIQSMKMTC